MRPLRTILILTALFSTSVLKAQDTIRICKDVRNIVFTIFTTQGKAVAWQWTVQGGVYSGSLTDSTCGPVSYPNVGVFQTTCNVTFDNGEDSLHRFIIIAFDGNVDPPSIRDTVLCGNGINLTVDAGAGANPLASFKWNPGNQTSRSINITSPGFYTASVFTVDDYSYNCVGCRACDSAWTTFEVRQGARPSVELGANRFICNGSPVTLDAGPDGISYQWSPNGQTSRSISVDIPGLYSVTVTNADGCTATDNINLRDSCPLYIWIPTAFSPENQSGINNIFNWSGNMRFLPNEFELRIYNRWGEKLYVTNDPLKGWDGKYKDKMCPQEFYVVIITGVDTNGTRQFHKGTFLLMR